MAINQTGSAGLAGATVPTVPGNLLKLMIASARMTEQQTGNLTTLFLNDPLPTGMGTTYNSPKFGVLTAYSLTQGIDMQQQQALTATNIAVTPAEVGVQIVLTQKSMAQWSENVAVRAGRIMRDAMDRKKDADISGLFAGFSRITGGATVVPAVGIITASIALLQSGPNIPATGVAQPAGIGYDVCNGPFITVVTPVSMHYLLRSLGGGAMGATTQAVLNPGADSGPESLKGKSVEQGAKAITQLGGASVYVNANLAKIATNDESDSFVGEKEAIVFVPMQYDSMGSMAEEADKSLRAIELNYVEDYGFAELDDNKGILMKLNNAPPTS
jgi:hypothetical protein